MYLTIFIAAVLQLAADAQAVSPVYTVSDANGPGTLTVEATK